MNTQSKKSTQIFLGILTGIGVWVIGHLMSGRLSFVEDMELYPTGPLVLIFPFVFAAACILVAKYSAKSGKDIYYKTSMVCFSLPPVCLIMAQLFAYIMELKVPVISRIADVVTLIFTLPTVAMYSIFYQLLDLVGIGTDGIKLVLIIAAYFIPMLAGMLISIKIYKDNSDN